MLRPEFVFVVGVLLAFVPACSGEDGADGAQGLPGLSGLDGSRGPAGPAGDDGVAGTTGPRGAAGRSGVDGLSVLLVSEEVAPDVETCPAGGQRVETGLDANGDGFLDEAEVEQTLFVCHGEDGIQGEQGQRGADGAQGEPGPRGPAGERGAQGLQGESGAEGLRGPAGPQGAQGQDGARGERGPIGAQGPQGVQGEPGLDGSNGERGEQGDPGLPGVEGEQGERGPPGVSGTLDVFEATCAFERGTHASLNCFSEPYTAGEDEVALIDFTVSFCTANLQDVLRMELTMGFLDDTGGVQGLFSDAGTVFGGGLGCASVTDTAFLGLDGGSDYRFNANALFQEALVGQGFARMRVQIQRIEGFTGR